MSEGGFLILCRATAPTELALWWKPNRAGYTRMLEQAGRYTLAEARAIEQVRGQDFAVPVLVAEELAKRVVALDQLAEFGGAAAKPPAACQDAWADECEGEVCKTCAFCPVHAYEANRQGEGVCGSCRERPPVLGPYQLGPGDPPPTGLEPF